MKIMPHERSITATPCPAPIASPSLHDPTHLPHTPAHIPSSASTRATPKTAREGEPRTMAGPQQVAHSCVSDSRGASKPTLVSDRDGGELTHSRDPGFVVAAVFLRVYRQASRCVLFPFTLASTMTRLLLELSLDTDGVIYLILVPTHVAFLNDSMRFQESKQRFTIPTGDGQVRHFIH